MNKKLLIISPHFPPLNAADMQRIRMSLPYFKQFGWDAEVVTVEPAYSEIVRDELLSQSVPAGIPVHYVKALSKTWTSKLGVGNIAFRAMGAYKKKVDRMLKEKHFDLVYFSTTQFAVCKLGAHWKARYNVPYVIDMQDPWHSDYYLDKPSHQRPKKFWLSYRLNKYLEGVAMKHVDGLISVSENYIKDLKSRYPEIKGIPAATITFGAFEPDIQIAKDHQNQFKPLLDKHSVNMVYIGRGGSDMQSSVLKLFTILKKGLKGEPDIFKKLKVYFIGTSYAPAGQSRETLLPLAGELGIKDSVIEITARISYYHTLTTLQNADALFIPGSDDPKYTASKIYPYLLTRKPLLAIFNPYSPAIGVLHEYGVKDVYSYEPSAESDERIYLFLRELAEKKLGPITLNASAVKKYSAENMARRQCELFDRVINEKN